MQVTLSAQSSQGSFQADRERDILSAALGNKEHPGRTRGIGLYDQWKDGFSKDSETYRSRKRAKAEREAELREEIRASLREEMWDVIREEIRASLTNQHKDQCLSCDPDAPCFPGPRRVYLSS